MSEPSSAVRGLAELVTLTRERAPRIVVPGLATGGAFAAAALARVADALAPADRPLVVVTPDEARATQLASAIQFFLADQTDAEVLHLPAIEMSDGTVESVSRLVFSSELTVPDRLHEQPSTVDRVADLLRLKAA